ncbi:MAG TPA: sodium/proton-translocating pyrophosphatase, partial [Chryseolinea sp.]|nr:sodium/proton-translocating pyrophosphatase [Chryseolinea sp.]
MSNATFALLIIGVSLVSLVFAYVRSRWIEKQDAGTEHMQRIAKYIADGALSFLKAEYKVLSIFVVITAVVLAVTANPETSHAVIGVAFVVGATLSALAGFI